MLRCSKEAFAQCPTSHLCGSREDATFTEGSECDKFNQEVASHPQTNAARIRAMNDRELIKLLSDFSAFPCVFPEKDCEEESCVDCVTKWLQQPAEEV